MGFLFDLVYVGGREACNSWPVTNDQARRMVLILSRFLTSCVADQIRLAPEKCTNLSSLWIKFKMCLSCSIVFQCT